MPFTAGPITIAPLPGRVTVGVPFTVSGDAEPGLETFGPGGGDRDIPPDRVTVALDGGTAQPATALSADWSSWEATLQAGTAGAHTITARAVWTVGVTAASSDDLGFDAVEVTLELVEPATQDVAGVRERQVSVIEFPVVVAGTHPAGLRTVEARVANQPWVALASDGQRWLGRLRLAGREVAGGGNVVRVDLRGVSNTDQVIRGGADVRALDAANPTIVSFVPAELAKLSGTVVGAAADVRVTVQDGGRDELTSTIDGVDARVDDGGWIAVPPEPGGDGTTYATSLFVPALDAHVITVRARDRSGRAAEAHHRVVVTAPADLRDLGRQTYLKDLLAFAGEHLWTRAPAAGAEAPLVTAGQIAEAVGQDVEGVANMGAGDAVAPVRTLRLVVEALRRFIRPEAPAPLASWPLREGQGQTVADTASARAAGRVEGATWVAGADPPVLRFDPNDAARVRVPAEAATQVAVGDRLSLVARIRPSRDTPDPGIVVNKEGEYELARFPDGTLRWAIATGPTWDWVDTGAVAPVGDWTHVAVSYDGSRVRTWIDGVLRHIADLTGSVGDVAPAMNELWIGGRPAVPQHFAGDIAEVAVFGRALAERDVLRLLGRDEDAGGARLWVDDDVPAGAELDTDRDAWEWVTADPAPAGGARCHRSLVASGEHQHLFRLGDRGFAIDRGDVLVTDVWLDPANPPREVMLQFRDEDGSWEHRAYWGENLVGFGTDGTEARRRIGDLPARGGWAQLRVPARLVGLESRTVHGVGYIVFDGRAAWDRTGRVPAAAAAAHSGYLQAAYAALLRAHGTSDVELRLARGAAAAAAAGQIERRRALAERLGITLSPGPNDELDQLQLDPDEVEATALAALFGYADPLGTTAAPVLPAISRWRRATLRERWRLADRGTPGAQGLPPVLDPEVLVADDVADASTQAARLLADRIAWRSAQVAAISARRSGAPDDATALAGALGAVLADVDLDRLSASRQAGQDISGALGTAGLTQRDLSRLLQLRGLAAGGRLRDDEWDDLVTVLVRVLRRRRWDAWRQEEAAADVVIDPAVFRDAALGGTAELPPFIDLAARQDWLDRLAARALAVQSLVAAQNAATARADDTALPLVRDALLVALDPGLAGLSVADALTSVLFVDVGAGAEDVTTRVDQAIEAVQGLVFAARTNRLVPQGPWPPPGLAAQWQLRETRRYPRAGFDEEWLWMGAFAAWRAAVSVYFRPELMAYPNLRPEPRDAYVALDRALTAAGSDLTPERARTLATAWLDDRTRTQLDQVTVRRRRTIDGTEADFPLSQFVLTDQLTADGLSALREGQQTLLAGTATLADIPRALQEVLWLVPLQLAVALGRVGEHLAAVDWLRTLYAHDQSGDDRVVFHGFRLEAGPPGPLQRPLNWLRGDELNPHRIADGRPGVQLRFTLLQLAMCLAEAADQHFTADTVESRPRARDLYLAASRSLRSAAFEDAQAPNAPRIPANPLLQALRGRVAANLGKLRRGLTIAGVPRPAAAAYEAADTQLVLPASNGGRLVPPARPPQPTPYRYATLVARAQQLLGLATQVEGAYLSALAGADEAGYSEERARGDLQLANARTTVQQAAVDVANDETKVAQLQAARATRQADTLEGWAAEGPSDWEQRLLDSYTEIAVLQTVVAASDAAVASLSAFASASAATVNTGAAFGYASAVTASAAVRAIGQGLAAFAQARSQEAATQASFERRTQEWQLQAALARDDAAIASQQGVVLQGRATVAANELAVARQEAQRAQAAVDYLARRRLTGELYAWMAGQLGEVYRYLLRQATSIAQLAQQQLAFERQQPPPDIIKLDYWTAPSLAAQGGSEPDRRGLAGSARLLRDLTELDQHAFETNRRKLNLEHTFALSRTAPEAFAEFRRTGVLAFATPMEDFARRFPDHILRTVRRVRLSLVALIPPAQGIAATLTCSGQSRVVVGQYGVFRPVTLTRQPETVAYTSPVGATGMFELDPQPDLKYFFEDHGVDTTWELRLPRPANAFDLQGVADVFITIEYTALADADYGRQVRAALPRRVRGTLAISVRDMFPDAWYALIEGDPDAPATIAPITLPVGVADFPRNVDDVRAEAVTLLVLRSGDRDDEAAELTVDHLALVRDDRRISGGAATAVSDVISSRLAASTSWSPLVDPPASVAAPGGNARPWDPAPFGDWELALAADADTRDLVRGGDVADLGLVISYRADLPEWPR